MKVYMLDDYWIGNYCVTCIAETKEKCIEAAWEKISEQFPKFASNYKSWSDWKIHANVDEHMEEVTLGECIIR